MATAMGKGREEEIHSPVGCGMGALVVERQMGPDAASNGAASEIPSHAVCFPRLAPWAKGRRRYAAWRVLHGNQDPAND